MPVLNCGFLIGSQQSLCEISWFLVIVVVLTFLGKLAMMVDFKYQLAEERFATELVYPIATTAVSFPQS